MHMTLHSGCIAVPVVGLMLVAVPVEARLSDTWQAVRDTASCGKRKVLLPLTLAKKRFGDLENWAGGPKYEKIAEEERAAVREECRQATRDLREAFAPKFGGEKLTDKTKRAADWAGRAKERITTRQGKADRALAIDDDERRLYTEELGIGDRERLPEVELNKYNVPSPVVEDDIQDSRSRIVRDLQPPPDPPDPYQEKLDEWAEALQNAQGADHTAWDPPASDHEPADTDTASDPYYHFEPDHPEDAHLRQIAQDLALPGEDGYQDALDALDQQEAEAHQQAERERLQQEAKAREAAAARERREREQEEREEAAWRARAAQQRRQQELVNEVANSLGQVIGTALAPSRSRSTGSSYSSGGSTGSGYSSGSSTGSGNYQPPKVVALPASCKGVEGIDTSNKIVPESYEYWDNLCRHVRDGTVYTSPSGRSGAGSYSGGGSTGSGYSGGSTGGGSRRTGGRGATQ